MSFIKRAREAAEAAATATRTVADPAAHERLGRQAKEVLGAARRGVATVVERIDPSTLAELVIKATALQEKTNTSLRQKKSQYRINEISISASIPPGISFVIGRLGEGELPSEPVVTSEELIETLPGADEAVLALDGTTTDVPLAESEAAP